MNRNPKIAICGFGKMGEALSLGLLKKEIFSPENILCTVGHPSSQSRITKLGLTVKQSNAEAAKEADIVIIATKPSVVGSVIDEIATVISGKQLLISIAAGVTSEQMGKKLKESVPIIRAMPNTPALIGQGMTVVCKGQHANDTHIEHAKKIFEAVGRVVELDEKQIDAVTGLSGCGPAYGFLIIEALAEAGVKVGIPREVSTLLTAQSILGAAQLVLETKSHPALLKDAVTTPGGCAIDGLLELEQGGVRTSLINAVVKATERARKLGTG